jgi:uncharacterized OB-fold protein
MSRTEPAAVAKPRPRLDGPEQIFWAGLKVRQIRVQQCKDCGRHRFPAARYCPKCHGPDFDWVQVAGRGEVESFCVFYKAYFPGFVAEMPYAVVQVKLDSGVRFFSNMVDEGDLSVGMQVTAEFEDVDAVLTLLKFRKAEAVP